MDADRLPFGLDLRNLLIAASGIAIEEDAAVCEASHFRRAFAGQRAEPRDNSGAGQIRFASEVSRALETARGTAEARNAEAVGASDLMAALPPVY
ncbi:MAG: hypothetical protein ABI317_12660 [Gaiellales bacterium]